jgi:hypothetical protein
VLLLASYAFAQSGTGSKKPRSQLRQLEGQVMDRTDAPVDNAVVYLKNSKTLVVNTYITGGDGKYRFPALATNVDYGVYAEYQGKKSDTKTLSSFDSRAQPYIALRIDLAK